MPTFNKFSPMYLFFFSSFYVYQQVPTIRIPFSLHKIIAFNLAIFHCSNLYCSVPSIEHVFLHQFQKKTKVLLILNISNETVLIIPAHASDRSLPNVDSVKLTLRLYIMNDTQSHCKSCLQALPPSPVYFNVSSHMHTKCKLGPMLQLRPQVTHVETPAYYKLVILKVNQTIF